MAAVHQAGKPDKASEPHPAKARVIIMVIMDVFDLHRSRERKPSDDEPRDQQPQRIFWHRHFPTASADTHFNQ